MADENGLVIALGAEAGLPSLGEEEPMDERKEMMLSASEALITAFERKDAAGVAQILEDIMAIGPGE